MHAGGTAWDAAGPLSRDVGTVSAETVTLVADRAAPAAPDATAPLASEAADACNAALSPGRTLAGKPADVCSALLSRRER